MEIASGMILMSFSYFVWLDRLETKDQSKTNLQATDKKLWMQIYFDTKHTKIRTVLNKIWKQPPEQFYEKVVLNKFWKIYSKVPAAESLFR